MTYHKNKDIVIKTKSRTKVGKEQNKQEQNKIQKRPRQEREETRQNNG